MAGGGGLDPPTLYVRGLNRIRVWCTLIISFRTFSNPLIFLTFSSPCDCMRWAGNKHKLEKALIFASAT